MTNEQNNTKATEAAVYDNAPPPKASVQGFFADTGWVVAEGAYDFVSSKVKAGPLTKGQKVSMGLNGLGGTANGALAYNAFNDGDLGGSIAYAASSLGDYMIMTGVLAKPGIILQSTAGVGLAGKKYIDAAGKEWEYFEKIYEDAALQRMSENQPGINANFVKYDKTPVGEVGLPTTDLYKHLKSSTEKLKGLANNPVMKLHETVEADYIFSIKQAHHATAKLHAETFNNPSPEPEKLKAALQDMEKTYEGSIRDLSGVANALADVQMMMVRAKNGHTVLKWAGDVTGYTTKDNFDASTSMGRQKIREYINDESWIGSATGAVVDRFNPLDKRGELMRLLDEMDKVDANRQSIKQALKEVNGVNENRTFHLQVSDGNGGTQLAEAASYSLMYQTAQRVITDRSSAKSGETIGSVAGVNWTGNSTNTTTPKNTNIIKDLGLDKMGVGTLLGGATALIAGFLSGPIGLALGAVAVGVGFMLDKSTADKQAAIPVLASGSQPKLNHPRSNGKDPSPAVAPPPSPVVVAAADVGR